MEVCGSFKAVGPNKAFQKVKVKNTILNIEKYL